MVAVLIVLEHILAAVDLNLHKFIHIFSDSQSAVGILELGWNSSSHHGIIRTIQDIRDHLHRLGLKSHLHWTPGHASIQGNEIADSQAKAAAEEAAKMDAEQSIVTTQDIHLATEKLILTKLKQRWELTDKGRHLYPFRTAVTLKKTPERVDKNNYIIIAQLRTGYCPLNDYRYKVGVIDNPTCQCDCGPETVQHYILECPLYEEDRYKLENSLRLITGEPCLSTELLLSEGPEDQHSKCRDLIAQALTDYIHSTKRFH